MMSVERNLDVVPGLLEPQAGQPGAEAARTAWRRPAVKRIKIMRTLNGSGTTGDAATNQTGGAAT